MKARSHRLAGWLAPLLLWSAACTSTPADDVVPPETGSQRRVDRGARRSSRVAMTTPSGVTGPDDEDYGAKEGARG